MPFRSTPIYVPHEANLVKQGGLFTRWGLDHVRLATSPLMSGSVGLALHDARASPSGWQAVEMEPRVSIVTLGVTDLERSYRFYAEGLGLPTTRRPEDGIVFFQTRGVVLALYPSSELADDVGPG